MDFSFKNSILIILCTEITSIEYFLIEQRIYASMKKSKDFENQSGQRIVRILYFISFLFQVPVNYF